MITTKKDFCEEYNGDETDYDTGNKEGSVFEIGVENDSGEYDPDERDNSDKKTWVTYDEEVFGFVNADREDEEVYPEFGITSFYYNSVLQ